MDFSCHVAFKQFAEVPRNEKPQEVTPIWKEHPRTDILSGGKGTFYQTGVSQKAEILERGFQSTHL